MSYVDWGAPDGEDRLSDAPTEDPNMRSLRQLCEQKDRIIEDQAAKLAKVEKRCRAEIAVNLHGSIDRYNEGRNDFAEVLLGMIVDGDER